MSTILGDKYGAVAPDDPGFGQAHDAAGYLAGDMVQRYADTSQALVLGHYFPVDHTMSGKLAAALGAAAANYGLPAPAKLVRVTSTSLGPEPLSEQESQEFLATDRDDPTAGAFVRSHSNVSLPAPILERAVEVVMRVNQPAWNAWLAGGPGRTGRAEWHRVPPRHWSSPPAATPTGVLRPKYN